VRRWLLLSALAASGGALAQADSNAGAQYPAPVNTFEVDAGYRYDYLPGAKNESYYRVSYKGAMVRSEGTPFKQASGLDLAAKPLAEGAGDRHKLSFRFEKNQATVSGGLFEAAGVEALGVDASGLALRGTAFAGADADGRVVQLAVGLETPPWRIPGLKGTQWSNWLVLGVSAQRQEATDAQNDDKNFGLLTYRAFVGKAFGWRKSADVGKTAARIANELLKMAPTYAAAQRKSQEITEAKPRPQDRSPDERLFQRAVVEAESEANWQKTVREMAHGRADAITDQPTYAIYIEDSGWYSDGLPFGGSKLKNLLTATVDYFFMPQRDDVYLRGRFENGYERATPTERKKQLLVSIGLRF
jgi:hypothetical protein